MQSTVEKSACKTPFARTRFLMFLREIASSGEGYILTEDQLERGEDDEDNRTMNFYGILC